MIYLDLSTTLAGDMGFFFERKKIENSEAEAGCLEEWEKKLFMTDRWLA
jgi:hypothetical protein